jgi:hypothetical protein
MSKRKWLILIALGAAVCVTVVSMLVIWVVLFGTQGVNPLLPVYAHDQTSSTHPGYRRSTITSGASVYVNDYEEYALQLENREPTDAVGRSPFGGGKICSIPGQKPTDYVAADVGSEMPAYEVFRNTQIPAFDWRHATFQKMEFATDHGPAAHKQTNDPALIEDVLRTLREGTPIPSPILVTGSSTNLHAVHMSSDQLPGLIFCPAVYTDPSGPVYLAESYVTEGAFSNQSIRAQWIPASPQFTKWTQTP